MPLQAARAASTAAAGSSIKHLVGNLNTLGDVEDLAITYGLQNSSLPVRKAAVVKIGGEVIQKQLDSLVPSLQALLAAGLQPVIIHGGGPQLNDELAKAGVEPEYIGGEQLQEGW